MNNKVFFVAVIFLALMLIPFAVSSTFACDSNLPDCQSTSEPSPTDYPTSSPTATSTPQATVIVTPTNTPTNTPTATPTQLPTATNIPTVTSTPSPTATPTPTLTPTSTPAPTLSPSEIAALACLLPTGDLSTNPLGVVDTCGSAPVPIRASRAPTIVVAKPTPTVAPTPKGDAPSSSMIISDTLLTLDAGGVHWFRIDNGSNFFLDVWLDTSGKSGITLALYAPEQTNALSVDLQPKGRGAPVKNEPTHDLLWKGAFAMGVWHVLVRNYNNFPVQYKIGSSQSTTIRVCRSYWEPINGVMTYWTNCGHDP